MSSTQSPTVSGPTTASEIITQWVLFGLFLLFALISPYISRLLFGILVSLKVGGKSVQWLARLEHYMLLPFTYLLMMAFFYLMIFVSFATYWDTRNTDSVTLFLYDAITFILQLFVYFFAIYGARRLALFLIETTGVVLTVYNVPVFSQPVIKEAITLVCVVLVLILTLFLIMVLLGNGNASSTDSSVSVISLLAGFNWITVSIIIGVSPVFRDILAGLSLFADNTFRANGCIRLESVSPIGYVKEFRLRLTVIEALDGSQVWIPNAKFLRYPMVDYTQSKLYRCEITVPIMKDTLSLKIRTLITHLQSSLKKIKGLVSEKDKKAIEASLTQHLTYSESVLPGKLNYNLAVTFDQEYRIVVQASFWCPSIEGVKRFQSELFLSVSKALEDHQVEIRGRSTCIYRSLQPNRIANRLYTD